MKEYTGFAEVYDMFMDNVPYDKWAKYLQKLLKENGAEKGIVCELGCGTGKMTRRLRDMGYDMIGIDISQDMLQIAMEQETILKKAGTQNADINKVESKHTKSDKKKNYEILYLNQDMREFELYGTVAAVVSICDSMNYITEKEDLLQTFKLVRNYLDPGGVFIFDMNTPYYYRKKLGEQTICENRDEGSFIWENYYDPDTKINEFDMTIYIRRNTNDAAHELYERFEETHFQRAYSIAEVKALLKRAGLKDIKVYKAFTKDTPDTVTERVYFLAKKDSSLRSE
ncbi:MAG: class I SAM-dependent methyltransferase [Lachnospiraceae bacterium]|nr:class I SAM-dependent methyltransferase [Lachnospiraceae bacterium]MBR4541484.1 class I SAM-dependent methyltransferase [Lachnospiraceae bacterium]